MRQGRVPGVTYARLDSRLRLVCRCMQTASVCGECDDSKAKPEHKNTKNTHTHSLQTTTDKLSKHAYTLPDSDIKFKLKDRKGTPVT